MVDWTKTFKAEYDYACDYLKNELNFSKEWQPLIKQLHKLMGADGFDSASASALTDLRKKVVQGESKLLGHNKITEDKGILQAVDGWTDDGASPVEAHKKMRAAALKLLRHVYLLNRSGNRKVWLVSLPVEPALRAGCCARRARGRPL
jgi:hypothetical protein